MAVHIKRHMGHLGQHIQHYVSEFRRCECNNYFVIREKPLRKHFDENNTSSKH